MTECILNRFVKAVITNIFIDGIDKLFVSH